MHNALFTIALQAILVATAVLVLAAIVREYVEQRRIDRG